MSGHILLEGGAEFNGHMAQPDLRAIQLAGGTEATICILPTAAVPDNNHRRAGHNGLRWFHKLGARRVEVIPLLDQDSANQPKIAEVLQRAKLIYLLGGFPGYLAQTLANSLSWQALLEAYQNGAIIAGSSAGAMVLCQVFFDPYQDEFAPGLNLLPGTCVIPHHNSGGRRWIEKLREQLAEYTLIGIDEQTGMIDNGENGKWKVYGKGQVTIYKENSPLIYTSAEEFDI